MKIAICDDDTLFAQRLAELLTQYFQSGENGSGRPDCAIDRFADTAGFLKSPLRQYDIVFLDVEVGGESGVEAARTLRRHNTGAVLVFISAYLKYATKGYEVNAFRYLLKDELETELPFCLKAVEKQLIARVRTFPFKTVEGTMLSVRAAEVLYVESLGHHVLLHTGAGRYRTYDTLANIMAKIPSDDFLHIQRSYYVNMRNVVEVKGCEVFFADGRSIMGSRKKKEAILQAFLSIQGEC